MCWWHAKINQSKPSYSQSIKLFTCNNRIPIGIWIRWKHRSHIFSFNSVISNSLKSSIRTVIQIIPPDPIHKHQQHFLRIRRKRRETNRHRYPYWQQNSHREQHHDRVHLWLEPWDRMRLIPPSSSSSDTWRRWAWESRQMAMLVRAKWRE